jgi:hypothetical protein
MLINIYNLVCIAVVISVTKEGVKFSTKGDIGSANIVCRQNTSVDKVRYCFTLYPIFNHEVLYVFGR